MNANAWLLLLLVWSVKGSPTSTELSPGEEDEEAIVSELARRLRPLESLESKQRRLEELEARQQMLNNLESSHRSLEGLPASQGCGGCSRSKARSRATEELEAQYMPDLRPRPLFGLLNEILETAQFGYKIDRPRPHLLF